MSKTRILVAEDDPAIRQGLVDIFEGEGYAVTAAKDGAEAIRCFEESRFDLVLLDVMMPRRSGFDVCRAIRSTDTRTPVVMLTAKGEEIDKVVGLELGADDYVTKPFGVRELLARVAAILRRSRGSVAAAPIESALPDVLDMAGCRIDRKRLQLERAGCAIDLSPRELGLLEYFYRHPREVLSRHVLLDAIWGVAYHGTTRTLDQHMAQLRKKVEQVPAEPRYLTTVHGVGYRYEPDAARVQVR